MDSATVQCGGECTRIAGILRANREHLEKTYHIRSIGLFGSCRRGEEHEGSDADILVEFSEVPGFFDFLRLEGHLTEIQGRKVDLVEKVHSSPASLAVSAKRSSLYKYLTPGRTHPYRRPKGPGEHKRPFGKKDL